MTPRNIVDSAISVDVFTSVVLSSDYHDMPAYGVVICILIIIATTTWGAFNAGRL